MNADDVDSTGGMPVKKQMKALSENIRRRRSELGMSQSDLAQQSQLNVTTINRIETDGEADPQISSISRIAKALNVETWELFRGFSPFNYPTQGDKPRYKTYSHWVWDRFYRMLEEFGETVNTDEELRPRFENFLRAIENRDIPNGEANELWLDRKKWLPSTPRTE